MASRKEAGFRLSFTLIEEAVFASSAPEKVHDMKRQPTKANDQEISELTREQLDHGVRGKYFESFAPIASNQGSAAAA